MKSRLINCKNNYHKLMFYLAYVMSQKIYQINYRVMVKSRVLKLYQKLININYKLIKSYTIIHNNFFRTNFITFILK